MKKVLSILMALVMLLCVIPAMAETTEHEPVTITFGGWGDICLLKDQCAKFTEKYPWITVDVVKEPGRDWYAADLTQLAVEGKMPDIINIENPLQANANGWCYDMTELFRNDPDSKNYPQDFLRYGVVDNKLVGLIGAMYVYGIEVNLSLLEELNIPKPGYDWTVEEWADILRKTTVPGTSWGTINMTEMLEYIFPQFDPNVNALGINTEDFTFTATDEWIECLSLVQGLIDDGVCLNTELSKNVTYSWENTPEQTEWLMQNLGAADNLWVRGKIGMRMRPSWNESWSFNNNELYTGFEWDWYPFPSATPGQMGRTALLNEFLSISATCEHPEEAYLLVKYMSYDMDGYEAKVDIIMNYDYDTMVAKYPEVPEQFVNHGLRIFLLGCSTEERADEIFAKYALETFPGMAAAFANRNNNSFLIPDRYLPGWWDAYGTMNWYLENEMARGLQDTATLAKWSEIEFNREIKTAWESYGNIPYGWTDQ